MKEELDVDFLEKLERLRLVVKKRKNLGYLGERESPKMGKGSEFSDYRSYQVGDELRYIDWNIYARFEKFLIKLFEEEEEVDIHILLDTSSSMGFGSPSKIFYGKQMALAFAYLGVSSWEKVNFAYFQDGIKEIFPLERKKGNIFELLKLLNTIEPDGITDMNNAIKNYLASLKRKGIIIIISDFLSPLGYKDGILFAKHKKFSVYLAHVISEEEISPGFRGNLCLIDSETNEKMEILLDDYMLERYRKTLEKFLDDIEKFSLSYQVEYMRSVTTIPVEDLLLKYLRVGGWVR
ncbi:MAG: DUF58 domain-containing protein [Dictyoglomaceae bacterium]|nr:DUF58 domain-containing protein [Dictyoglomaceae bacterium]HPU43142.1 DUF58 domain-containing protein [Dictyoglomaceae bacterium]